MTLTTAAKNWLAQNAGVDNCFSPTGVVYKLPDEADTRTGSTGDVLANFWTLMGIAPNAKLIANTSYNEFKVINGGFDIDIDNDVLFAYNNDGSGTLSAYCYTSPADITATAITPDFLTCLAPCDMTINITWINNGGTSGDFVPTMIFDGTPAPQLSSESLAAGASVMKSFTVSGLLAGNHTVQATPGTLTAVTIAVNASVYLTSDPTGASVYIDNAETSSGPTPITVQNLPIGSHGYRLTYVGCDNEPTGNFTIDVGSSTVNVPIISFNGNARFTSAPAGAEIWIDGVDKGVLTPGDVTGLTAGNHTLTLKLSGYIDFTESFTVTPCQLHDHVQSNLSKVSEAGFGPILIGGLVVGALLFGQGKGLDVGRKGKVESLTIKQIRESPTQPEMSKTKSAQVSRSNISNN
jgi:hypothetical protein